MFWGHSKNFAFSFTVSKDLLSAIEQSPLERSYYQKNLRVEYFFSKSKKHRDGKNPLKAHKTLYTSNLVLLHLQHSIPKASILWTSQRKCHVSLALEMLVLLFPLYFLCWSSLVPIPVLNQFCSFMG